MAASALMAAPGAIAATAAPAVTSLDCSATVPATTITGRVGDTFQLTNTAGTCAFTGTTGVITVSGLSGSNLGTGQSATATIIAAGSFTVTPTSGSAGTVTITIGDPNPAPEYTITFDANGGDCSSNPLVITAAATDWYALPTDGTGPYQCYRDGYALAGWVRGDTLQFGGTADRVPDVPAGSQASAADHVTFYASWHPRGVELTLDANVAASDTCLNSRGWNIAPAARTTTQVIPAAEWGSYRLPSSAPCTPPRHTFAGWSVQSGAQQGSVNGTFEPGTSATDGVVRLYAMWQAAPREICLEPRANTFNIVGFNGYSGTMTVTVAGYCGSAPGSYEIETSISLPGADCSYPSSCTTSVPYSATGAVPVEVSPARVLSPSGSGQFIVANASPQFVGINMLTFEVQVVATAPSPTQADKAVVIQATNTEGNPYSITWTGITN